jgi:hypothetical protein
MARESQWSEAIAVGNLNLVEKVKSELGIKAAHPDSGWFKPLKPFDTTLVSLLRTHGSDPDARSLPCSTRSGVQGYSIRSSPSWE